MLGHVAGLPTRPNARLRSITALIAAAVHQARLTRLVGVKQLPAQPPATLHRGVEADLRPPRAIPVEVLPHDQSPRLQNNILVNSSILKPSLGTGRRSSGVPGDRRSRSGVSAAAGF